MQSIKEIQVKNQGHSKLVHNVFDNKFYQLHRQNVGEAGPTLDMRSRSHLKEKFQTNP